jgi:asparagine synthase (glutamine-hydrolysing)
MCGIAGVLVFKNENFKISEDWLTSIRDTMIHRGPDGGHNWISSERNVGLAHRRLSIIDLSTIADQPMSNHDDSVWLVFNGEIYNHADIRSELIALNKYVWKTDHSDTEVILHAYEEWGYECVHKFRGMFAIALWDIKKQKLWLVRDRLGVKPLYYSIYSGRLVFASEIKAILQDCERTREVNEFALYHYLSFMTTPAPDTLFEGIKKMHPGEWLEIEFDGSVKAVKYWDIWDNAKSLGDKSDDEIAALLLEELKTSVKLRKVSDVPVGVFLSGGIDSSTNTALFSEGESNVKTFTIGYSGEFESYQNETHYAKQMADVANAEYYEKLLTLDDIINFLPEMIHLQDEPIADPVCVPVYYVSKLARENGVIVCQVGEGADELFWGYSSWKLRLETQKKANWPVPRIFKKMILQGLDLIGKIRNYPYEIIRRDSLKQPIFWGGADCFTDRQKKEVLSPRLKEKFKNYTSWEAIKPYYNKFKAKAWEKSDLNWMSYLDLNFRLPELLLMRVDKMAMGVSLEGRVPFLDYKFVELAMSIPEKVKTRKGINKYILKMAVRGVIPDELIDRKKQGFGVPIQEFLLDRLGDKARQELFAFCDETDFLSRDGVKKLIENNDSTRVWMLLNFAMWWNHYIKPFKKQNYV